MAQFFPTEERALVQVHFGDDVKGGSRSSVSSTSTRLTLDVHSPAENSVAAENEEYDEGAVESHGAEEPSPLSHDEVDGLSMNPGPSPLEADVPETRLFERLQAPALSVAQPKEDSVDVGIQSMITRSDETEDYSASVPVDYGERYGIYVANENHVGHLARSMSCYSTAPMSPYEMAQQSCLSTSPDLRREAPIYSCSPMHFANAPTTEFCNAKFDDTHVAETRTTVMLMNVPLGYTSSKLMRTIDSENFAGLYDFIYVPMDFKKRASKGCAFVNLLDPLIAKRFLTAFDGFSRWSTTSKNVCHAHWAKTFQGLRANIDRYRSSTVMMGSVPHEYKPRVFRNGTEINFPPPPRKPCVAKRSTERPQQTLQQVQALSL